MAIQCSCVCSCVWGGGGGSVCKLVQGSDYIRSNICSQSGLNPRQLDQKVCSLTTRHSEAHYQNRKGNNNLLFFYYLFLKATLQNLIQSDKGFKFLTSLPNFWSGFNQNLISSYINQYKKYLNIKFRFLLKYNFFDFRYIRFYY